MNHVGALEITTVRDFLTTAMNSFYVLSGQEAADQAAGVCFFCIVASLRCGFFAWGVGCGVVVGVFVCRRSTVVPEHGVRTPLLLTHHTHQPTNQPPQQTNTAGRRTGAAGGGGSALANAGAPRGSLNGPPRKLRRYRGDAPSETTTN